MLREQLPNLLRLYVNPHVAQACYYLTRYISEAWSGLVEADDYQVFLANSVEEALSGAIKLARYAANAEGAPGTGLIVDENGRFDHFAYTELAGHGRLEFIPGIEVTLDASALARRLADSKSPVGFVVVPHALLALDESRVAALSAAGTAAPHPLLIVCTDQQQLTAGGRGSCRAASGELPADGSAGASPSHQQPAQRAPDIVIFDESFVNGEVPFGAFAATKRLFRHWNKRGMTTFHSTTYQPNTISTLHLMNCLRAAAPDFIVRHQTALRRIEDDPKYRFATFRDLYSRSLARLTRAVGMDNAVVRAAGHYVSVSGKQIFDGVAGVACSIRGHNPPSYVDEIRQPGDLESWREELTERLAALTGLAHMVPAVSGASAVEHALKLALASQFPRDCVLALCGGFGGKTLFALTGTWKSSLRAGLAPLYPNVVYVDPFADDAVAALQVAFREHSIGVVQIELIQGVGGVRAIPAGVLQHLAELRRKSDFLLFVDEIQTAMFRTGPFVRSQEVGIQPDLLTIGKGTSDMMFPFAMTLYSDAIQQRLDQRDCPLPEAIQARFSYQTGIHTVLNTLRRANADNIPERVRQRSALFARLLAEELGDCPLVRDVRCFGLLIGIELDARRRPQRWLKKLIYQLYLLAMLDHEKFPLLVGFCQYEPNVLKLTPPLSVTEDEVHGICETISSVLYRPLSRVALSGLMQMSLQPRLKWLPTRSSYEMNQEKKS
jgi:acetylornithine/succinyldiaminopimelate/putrescine aminotransferase